MAHKLDDEPTLGSSSEFHAVLTELTALREEIVAAARSQSELTDIHPNYRESARNLLHYLAFRRRDLRPLQLRLAALGLSSLGRAESHVLAAVDAVFDVVCRVLRKRPAKVDAHAGIDLAAGQQLLASHADALLGPAPAGRSVRIMVTMPTEAARDYALVYDLLRLGMNCMRINCAHDSPAEWQRMIDHLRRAEQALGRTCRIVMDLAGPKLRTGPLEAGPAVLRIRPTRDIFGRVTAPARVWLTSRDAPQAPPSYADAVLRVAPDWLEHLQVGEIVSFRDARHAKRRFDIVDVTADGCWALLEQTAYLVPETILRRDRKSGLRETPVSDLPRLEQPIRLNVGDRLILTRDQQPGRPARLDTAGRVLTPAHIGCSLPHVFDDVRPGEAIWFDDGKIGGVVDDIDRQRVVVRIIQARAGGDSLRAQKGINLPESNLRLPALTETDLACLPFVATHADVIELSFANSAADVNALREQLDRLGDRCPAVVLKIETRRGFENLPDMLLSAMRLPCIGVMIARGDLAVECGFERLAEVQEEILWVCEAAHVPVIWATQVLESLAKQGMPSRAEITDAAMGHRAECVMLNKGPHMVSAVRVLDDILRRMQAHQAKKRSMLRELRLAHRLTMPSP
jgi:pyruvate kinase